MQHALPLDYASTYPLPVLVKSYRQALQKKAEQETEVVFQMFSPLMQHVVCHHTILQISDSLDIKKARYNQGDIPDEQEAHRQNEMAYNRSSDHTHFERLHLLK